MNTSARYPSLYFTREQRFAPLPIDGSRAVVGRGSACQIAVDDPHCSRQQLAITIHSGQPPLLELLSENVPVHRNGKRVTAPETLEHGDRLDFGSTEARLLLREDPEFASAAGDGPADFGATLIRGEGMREPAKTPLPAVANLSLRGTRTIIGRAVGPDGILLEHPMVSRRHAVVDVQGDRVYLQDHGSANGTFHNGSPVQRAVELRPGDRVDIGPFALRFNGQGFDSDGFPGEATIVGTGLIRTVKSLQDGSPLRILDGVDLVIEAGEFVCLVGPSGCGKTTLMNALSARHPATEGSVTINGLDLYAHFEALKRGVALIPQHEVLHEELTLGSALAHTARLRLPPDTSEADIASAVADALRSVELSERADVPIRALSGGQKKRASLANEILSRPDILFLDEVTSGLDEQTDWEMMKLFSRFAAEGMTIVCVTHTLANVAEFCDRVVIMTPPGVMTFFGSPREALDYFGVSELGGIYRALAAKGAEEWRAEFSRHPHHAEYVSERIRKHRPTTPLAPPAQPRDARNVAGEIFRQLRIVTRRYVELTLSDRKTLMIAAGQSLLVGALLALVYSEVNLEHPAHQFSLVFLLGLSSFWFGCNNASREIVKERAIYRRERDVNLSVVSYLLSKILVLGVLAVVQAGLFAAVTLALNEIPGTVATQLLLMLVAAFCGSCAGLFISAISKTRDQANTLIPIFLIPQIILAGLIVPLKGVADFLSNAFVSGFWIFDGMSAVLKDDDGDAVLALCVLLLHALLFCAAALWVLVVRDGRGQGLYGAAVSTWVSKALSKKR